MSSAAPIYFGPAARPRFGWLHAGAARSVGVVIANPFGFEAICAHRSLRHAAARLSAAGFTTLRFDYDGTGDSAGSNHDPDRVGAWLQSVHDAIDAVKERAGVGTVCVMGLRLGALLATAAAAQREDVAAIIALAPVVSGRAYARELRFLQGALELEGPPAGVVVPEGVQEALGFALADATREALGKLDLTKLTWRDGVTAPRVLVLDRNDLPVADKWVAHLKAQGTSVDDRQVPGYVEMVLDPHNAIVPDAMLGVATEWMKDTFPTAPTERPALDLATEASANVDGVQERALFFGAPSRLFGVVSSPAPGTATGRAIVLLNAGSVHRVGPNRLYTVFARRWAARGDLVLRCDLSGIGDSPARPGQPENVVYGPEALADVRLAVAWLRAQPGVRRVYTMGLCSGAYHGLKAAVAEQPIDGVVSINPLTYFYDPGEDLDARAHKVVSEAQRYSQSARDLDKWKKLLRGEVNTRVLARTLLGRARALGVNRGREVFRRLGLRWPKDVGAELESCAKRGVPVEFVFASDDPGMPLLYEQGGSLVLELQRRRKIGVRTVDNPDHTFTQLWSHELLADALEGALVELDRAAR
jgi:alpha/beta superfamily hydrolase